MDIKVIKNRIFDGTKTYEVGDVIKGLSEKDESQLVSSGHIEYVYTKDDVVTPETPTDEANGNVETVNDGEKDSSEDEDISTEIETNPSDLIDPSSFALNPDDYIKDSPAKKKK